SNATIPTANDLYVMARSSSRRVRRTSGGRKTFVAQLRLCLVALLEAADAHRLRYLRRLRELHVAIVDRLHVVAHGSRKSSEGGCETCTPAASSSARSASLSSTTRPKWRSVSGGCERPRANARNWSPMSTNAIDWPARPRSVRSKKRPYQASASSTSPTSSATWLIPTSFTTTWNVARQALSSHACVRRRSDGRDRSAARAAARRGRARGRGHDPVPGEGGVAAPTRRRPVRVRRLRPGRARADRRRRRHRPAHRPARRRRGAARVVRRERPNAHRGNEESRRRRRRREGPVAEHRLAAVREAAGGRGRARADGARQRRRRHPLWAAVRAGDVLRERAARPAARARRRGRAQNDGLPRRGARNRHGGGVMELGIYTFGELTDATQTPAERLRDLLEEIELADQVGLDVFGVGEHHRPDFVVSAPAVVLAAAAARTQRIRLTSAVSVLSSDDPIRVFQQFATVDLLSNGRAEIMAGRGSFIESFPLFGYDLKDYDELFSAKLERLLEIRARPAELGVHPAPVQPMLPVWVAVGGTPESAARAGGL